jgi:protein MAK11
MLLTFVYFQNTRKYDLFQSFSTHSHTSSIRTVATNGGLAASGGADDRICIYDLKNRKEIDDLYIHDGKNP